MAIENDELLSEEKSLADMNNYFVNISRSE